MREPNEESMKDRWKGKTVIIYFIILTTAAWRECNAKASTDDGDDDGEVDDDDDEDVGKEGRLYGELEKKKRLRKPNSPNYKPRLRKTK